ncbi:MAG: universal stress protein [Nitrospiraceae bacterium]
MHLLVAVDGSEFSQWAVDALALFAGHGVERVSLVHTIDAQMPKRSGAPTPTRMAHLVRRLDTRGNTLLCSMSQRASLALGQGRTGAAISIDTTIVQGRPGPSLVLEAKRRRADTILLGSRGLSDIRGFLLGSVSRYVAAHSPCPVLVVKRPLRSLRRMVLAVDASKPSRAAAQFAVDTWLDAGTAVSVVSVANSGLTDLAADVLSATDVQKLVQPHLDEAEAVVEVTRTKLLPTGCTVTTHVAAGHPSEAILEQAKSTQAELIVVGSRGLLGDQRLLLGSVAETVLKYAGCSVAVVRQAR